MTGSEISIQVFSPETNLSGDGKDEWTPIWGGGMSMVVNFLEPTKENPAWGGYIIMRNAGSTEEGDWDTQEIRSEFTLKGATR